MKKSPFYTHRQYLINELSKLDRTKPVTCLEFGAGHGSSPLFKETVKKNSNICVHSFEGDYQWYKKAVSKYATYHYNFNYVPDWDALYEVNDFSAVYGYDLVFVDQSPWAARIQTIERLRDKVKLFILHDYDYYNKGVIDDIYSVGEGSFFYDRFNDDFVLDAKTEFLPPTLILRKKINHG